jgi:hypothetical protein
MNGLPEFGLTPQRLAADIRRRMGDIVEMIPLITSNEQWQAILAKADPDKREDVRHLIEPMLNFQVPGGLPQAPEELRRVVLGATGVLEHAAQEGVVAEGDQQQHQNGDRRGEAAEAGGGHRAEQGGEVEQEVSPLLKLANEAFLKQAKKVTMHPADFRPLAKGVLAPIQTDGVITRWGTVWGITWVTDTRFKKGQVEFL